MSVVSAPVPAIVHRQAHRLTRRRRKGARRVGRAVAQPRAALSIVEAGLADREEATTRIDAGVAGIGRIDAAVERSRVARSGIERSSVEAARAPLVDRAEWAVAAPNVEGLFIARVGALARNGAGNVVAGAAVERRAAVDSAEADVERARGARCARRGRHAVAGRRAEDDAGAR